MLQNSNLQNLDIWKFEKFINRKFLKFASSIVLFKMQSLKLKEITKPESLNWKN